MPSLSPVATTEDMPIATPTRTPTSLGLSIPAFVPHGISVSLPTWQDNVAYEEGERRVLDKMSSGYPRFYIHKQIQQLQTVCMRKFGQPNEHCLLFPSLRIAEACRAFMHAHSPNPSNPIAVRIAQFIIRPKDHRQVAPNGTTESSSADRIPVDLYIVLFPTEHTPLARQFWQHTGNGISSRLAEYCLSLLPLSDLPAEKFGNNVLEARPTSPTAQWNNRGRNKHYASQPPKGAAARSVLSPSFDEVTPDVITYLEERYGRNLPVSSAALTKTALRRRVVSGLAHDAESVTPSDQVVPRATLSEEDVYLYPSGMSAIWHAHQLAMATMPAAKSICFGFPYTDTYKILQKWGQGCHFFGHGLNADIDKLSELLETSGNAHPALALFCEFPSNPLLRSPDLNRLRALADKYNFLIVVDETIGSFANVEVLPFADIVVSSLTKVFSGETNVMGGSLVLNPLSHHYTMLKDKMNATYEDIYWMEDAIFLERNSRDFIDRVHKINRNAEVVCELLRAKSQATADEAKEGEGPTVIKEVYYPKWITRENYEACRVGSSSQSSAHPPTSREGGYGGLFSVTFTSSRASEAFFDALACEKGPSLGTNFTLACPYTILAHYTELDWAAAYGVEKGLIRVSVGLEDEEVLKGWFGEALRKAEEVLQA